MNGFGNLIGAVNGIQKAIEKGIEDGLKLAGAHVVGTAKEKLGEYQPASGEYAAWATLKPESIRRKFLSKSKSFHVNGNGRVRINITNSGKKYLKKYGRNAKVFGAGKQFQSSGTGDDSPLVDTGDLRAAIRMDATDVSKGNVYVGVGGGGSGGKGSSPAKYAAAHEFGFAKKNLPPRPYLRPSIYENKEQIEEDIKKAIADAIMGVSGR